MCAEILSVTMVLWSEYWVSFSGPAVFVISWQWYYDWWAFRHEMVPTGEEQWGNLDLHMIRSVLATYETLRNRSNASNCVPMWCFIQRHMLHLPLESFQLCQKKRGSSSTIIHRMLQNLRNFRTKYRLILQHSLWTIKEHVGYLKAFYCILSLHDCMTGGGKEGLTLVLPKQLPVNDSMAVQEHQSWRDLGSIKPWPRLVELPRALNLKHQVASVDILHHKKQPILWRKEEPLFLRRS